MPLTQKAMYEKKAYSRMASRDQTCDEDILLLQTKFYDSAVHIHLYAIIWFECLDVCSLHTNNR